MRQLVLYTHILNRLIFFAATWRWNQSIVKGLKREKNKCNGIFEATFENVKWTKNFDNFETVDDCFDEDEDVETNDDTTIESVKEKKGKKINKLIKSSIREKSSRKKTEEKVSNEKHVPIVLIKRFATWCIYFIWWFKTFDE